VPPHGAVASRAERLRVSLNAANMTHGRTQDGDSVEAGMVAAFPVAESFHDPPCGAANAVCGRRQGSATATQEGR